jgi:hypothetical protein
MAMAKSPDERHQSAGEFAAAVRDALSDGSAPVTHAKEPARTRPFGVGAMRAFGWNGDPALGDWARRVADQAAAVAGSIGIPTIGPSTEDHPESAELDVPRWKAGRPDSSTDSLGRDALDISLYVAETVSKKAFGNASEVFWTKLKSTMTPARNEPRDDPSQADDTVVLTTVFEEGPNRTVIEVRLPARAAKESELDLDQILSDAYAAANAQAMGDLRGKHVVVSTDASVSGPAVVDVRDAEPETHG